MAININFDTDLDRQRSSTVETIVPVVHDELTVVRPVPREERTTHVGQASTEWSWEQLRDYVVGQIERIHGEFPKEPLKLKGIFSGFVSRHGADAGPIAQAAFETCGGYWKGAPISVNRFCRASDPWFAEIIKERLHQG